MPFFHVRLAGRKSHPADVQLVAGSVQSRKAFSKQVQRLVIILHRLGFPGLASTSLSPCLVRGPSGTDGQ